MEEKSMLSTKPLAIIAFFMAVLSVNSFNVFMVVAFIALFVFAALVCKDRVGVLSVLDAIFLYLANCLVCFAFAQIQGIINFFLDIAKEAQNPPAMRITFGILYFVIGAGFAGIAIISLFNVLGGKPARTLMVDGIAAKALDMAAPRQYQQAPNYQAPPSAPYQPQPTPPPQQNNAPWVCSSCGRQNVGAFCVGCGNKKG